MEKTTVTAGEKKFTAEVADSILRKAWGLSMRTEGKMLFKFRRSSRPRIDMMLVQKPLNLYFLSEEKEVIDVQKADPWTPNPRTWKTYRPSKPAKYLIESFQEIGLKEGEKVSF